MPFTFSTMSVTTRVCQALLLYLLISVPIYVRSQQTSSPDPYLLVNTLNDNSGLPQNSIITQYIDTSSGMLWLATFGGLVRYNGISLRSFNHDHDNALLTNKLVNLFRTYNGDVYAMNVHSQLLKIGAQDISINQSLTWIWQQYSLYVWFRGVLHSTDQIPRLGVHAFGKKAYYAGQENWLATLYDYYVTAIPNNRFAVISKQHELLIYSDSLIRFRQQLPFKSDSIRIFLSGGLLYILNNQLDGVCYDVRGEQPVPVPGAFTRLESIRAAAGKTQLYYNELNNQAIVSRGRELFVLASDANGLYPAYHVAVEQMPKSISSILFYPRHRTLFIGTSTEGLFVFRKNNFKQLLAPDLALNINSVYAQIQKDSNRLLTSRGVTFNLVNNGSAYTQEKNSMYSPFVLDSAGGYYWCNENTVQYQPPGGGPASIFYRKSDTSRKDNRICFVWLDPATQKLWVMETYQWGYFFQGRYYVCIHSPRNKMPHPCYFTRKGKFIYLATERGLVKLDEATGQWSFVSQTRNMEARFVAADPQYPVCWFSTYGHGFGAYLPEKDTVVFFPQDATSYLSSTHALIEDSSRNIWLPTNKGLFRVQKSLLLHFIDHPGSRDILHYDYFDRQEGLMTNEFNGGAQPIFTRWRDELLLSTINGVLRFSPGTIPGKVLSEPFFIDYAETPDHKYIKPAGEGVWEFNKEDRDLKWVFNQACWGNPYSLRVEYRIDERSEWKVVEGNRLVTEQERIGGGDHTLHIRRYNAAEGKYIEKAIPFRIDLYWYETWWCWALAMLLLMGLIIFVTLHFSFLKNVLKVSRKKDQVLSETLTLMEEGNAMLDASNLYKAKVMHVLMHDITVPVASIEKVSGMISRNLEKVSPDTIRTVMKEINDATRNLLILSDQLIQWSNIQDTDNSTSVEPADVHAVVEEIREELGDRFQWRNNELINRVPEDMQMQTKVHLLHHLLFNLVLNANKNMKDGVIEVEASQTQGYTVLIVKDNGASMDTELREQLITASASHDSSAVYSGHRLWHIGYQIIFDLVQLMKGEIEIKAGEHETGLIIAIGLPPLHEMSRK
ncbi:signal transduction histidine kinase [Pseudobacter ginsenosidimutans]|uniref:histidine kinase n=2 Tax=Pseudobacter ginsenosidimutans TaxID=661488 RepID=A0A4Q7M7K0_9BACT|nr:signal transduction histidine kinase [Pseudobacter ginsenosidimutans]